MPATKSSQDQINELQKDVGVLQGTTKSFEKFFQKLDTDIVYLTHLTEDRRKETVDIVDKLEEKFTEQFDKINNLVTTELAAIKTVSGNRFKKLEKWQAMIIGASIVIGIFISNIVINVFHKAIDPVPTTNVQVVQPPTIQK